MAVPKKRTSKSKSNHRKTLWKKKAFQKLKRCFLKSKYFLSRRTVMTNSMNESQSIARSAKSSR